uniref:Uncharacterized protein n=1 Tax=Ditylenchus dipsaci TaxID=166011 RepID=A0A915CQ08_9BILA
MQILYPATQTPHFSITEPNLNPKYTTSVGTTQNHLPTSDTPHTHVSHIITTLIHSTLPGIRTLRCLGHYPLTPTFSDTTEKETKQFTGLHDATPSSAPDFFSSPATIGSLSFSPFLMSRHILDPIHEITTLSADHSLSLFQEHLTGLVKTSSQTSGVREVFKTPASCTLNREKPRKYFF